MAFNDGDVATGRQAFEFEVDLAKTDNFTKICPMGFDEEMNIESEEWDDMCTLTSNVATTGIKPNWSGSAVVKKGSPEADIALNRFDVGKMTNIPFVKRDRLLDEEVTGFVSVTSLKIVYQAKELIKIDLTFGTIGVVTQTTPIPVTP